MCQTCTRRVCKCHPMPRFWGNCQPDVWQRCSTCPAGYQGCNQQFVLFVYPLGAAWPFSCNWYIFVAWAQRKAPKNHGQRGQQKGGGGGGQRGERGESRAIGWAQRAQGQPWAASAAKKKQGWGTGPNFPTCSIDAQWCPILAYFKGPRGHDGLSNVQHQQI